MDLPKNVAVVKYASVKDLQNVAKKLDNNIIALEKVSKKNTDDIENIEYWLIKFIIIGIIIFLLCVGLLIDVTVVTKNHDELEKVLMKYVRDQLFCTE